MAGLNKAVLAAFGLGTVAGIVAGCQVYDFEPVVPLTIEQYTYEAEIIAQRFKPNLMLLVDKSGSMDLPVDTSIPQCTFPDGGLCGVNKNLCDPSECPTRWTELQGAMDEFLTNSGTVARMGLATYPTNQVCGLPDAFMEIRANIVNATDEELAALESGANAVNDVIQGISSAGSAGTTNTTGGGTPTGNSIALLASLPELTADDGRDDYLLVLTDGLPNCNANHPTPAPDPRCRCTATSCADGERLRCLDDEGAVAAIAAARQAGVKTIVVGFGAELSSGIAGDILNQMAEAGGFARTCPDGGGCAAGDTCNLATDPPTCTNIKYFQANSRTELAAALAAISASIATDACVFPLPPGSEPPDDDPRFIVVYLTPEGEATQRLSVGPDTFQYTPGTPAVVRLVGSTCELVRGATPINPVNIRLSVVSTL